MFSLLIALVDRANRITITKEEIEELSEDSALERRKRLEAFGGISTVCNVLDSSPVTGKYIFQALT